VPKFSHGKQAVRPLSVKTLCFQWFYCWPVVGIAPAKEGLSEKIFNQNQTERKNYEADPI
jgi:hypothetical protein